MITVTIKGPDPKEPSFIRELRISNATVGEVPKFRDPDHKSTYLVELLVISPLNDTIGLRDEAKFEHRYGDDLLSLVMESIQALGGIRGVDQPGRKR